MITIEKDIPAPTSAKVVRIALDKMEVHDSFFLPNVTESVRTMVYREMREHKNQFVTRADGSGVRVWRLA